MSGDEIHGPAFEQMYKRRDFDEELVVWCNEFAPGAGEGAWECRMTHPFAGFESESGETAAEMYLEEDGEAEGGYTVVGLHGNYDNEDLTHREKCLMEFAGQILRPSEVLSKEDRGELTLLRVKL
jgi:hypothetical protein